MTLRTVRHTLNFEMVESRSFPGEWHVEAIGFDGEIFMVVFSGPTPGQAEGMAREYMEWMNSRQVSLDYRVPVGYKV
jgi:hypothetical protein